MLFGFQAKGESRVISISLTRSSLRAAAFTDALTRFYLGEPGPFAPATPIGVAEKGPLTSDPPMAAPVLARQTAGFSAEVAAVESTGGAVAAPEACCSNTVSRCEENQRGDDYGDERSR